jgi:rSAM/selenodomain-associated transferase 1
MRDTVPDISPSPPQPGASGQLIVFLKAPRPGIVKTRLAAQLDAEAATAIHEVLVTRTLAAVRRARLGAIEIRLTPDDATNEIARWMQPEWQIRPQGDGDLGARMTRALRDAFNEGRSPVVVIGTDCPALEPSDIRSALDALAQHDLVLGPATDGGYWLIGMRVWVPQVFERIPWSTPAVLATTRSRAETAGLRTVLLRQLADVDTLEDWRAWLRR